MQVEFWYKKPTPQSKNITRPTSKGLIVDGVKYTWKEVEAKWGMTGKKFSKRLHANGHWTMEQLLTRPFQIQRKKTKGKRLNGSKEDIRNFRKGGYSHLPEQLEANRIACKRWV